MNRTTVTLAAILSLALCCAHESTAPKGPPPCPYESAHDGTQSYEILCREPVTNHAKVKHVLIGWKDLATPEHPQPSERTYAEAQALARQLLDQLHAGTAIETLMAQYSEDPASGKTGLAYEATPGANLVSQFKSLSLRLEIGEAGIVKSMFGLHVIQRVQ